MTSFKEWPSDGGPHTSDSIAQAEAGLVACDASGNPISGMLTPPVISLVPGAWKVQIGRFVYVRGVAGGAYRSGLSAAEQVDITSAAGIPAGQSRIDLIAWNAVAGQLVVVPGTAGTSPAPPAPGAFAPIAHVLVKSGDAQVVAAQISLVFVKSGGGGAVTATVPCVLVGPTGGASGFYWRSYTVAFEKPFLEPPHLLVSGVFAAEAVQLIQVTSVTKTGFTGRVVRVAHATVLGGSVTYTATEK